MIKFCNEILRSFKEEGDPASVKFDNEEVIAGRRRYFDYLLRELDDEIAKQVPNYKEYLQVIKSVGKMQFTSDQFDTAWQKRFKAVHESSVEGLRELFEFSVMGFLKPGGGGGGSKYIWRYQDSSARFSYDASTFRVHAGFREALDLSLGSA